MSEVKHVETPQTHHAKESSPEAVSAGQEGRKYSLTRIAVGLLLLAAAVSGVVLALWAYRAEKEAHKAVHEAAEEREQTKKEVEKYKQEREQVEKDRNALASQRDEAVEEEKEAKESVSGMKSVLEFFQGNVLSAGRRSVGWTGAQGKEVTLRKAVDAAELKVDSAFAGKPLGEAAIREMLGSTYLDLGEPKLAVKQYERAMALREAWQKEDHPDAVICRNLLAKAYRAANQEIQAGKLYDDNKNSSTHATALAIRASALLTKKKPVEAEKLLRESLTIWEKIKPDDWSKFAAQSQLGEALLDQKKNEEAEKLLLSGYEGMKKREDKIPAEEKFRLAKALERLVLLYESTGKEDKAKHWGKELAKEQDVLIRSTK